MGRRASTIRLIMSICASILTLARWMKWISGSSSSSEIGLLSRKGSSWPPSSAAATTTPSSMTLPPPSTARNSKMRRPDSWGVPTLMSRPMSSAYISSRRMYLAKESLHLRVDSSRTPSKEKESMAMSRLRRRMIERRMKKRYSTTKSTRSKYCQPLSSDAVTTEPRSISNSVPRKASCMVLVKAPCHLLNFGTRPTGSKPWALG
mmetsp:Transcript_34786/g.83004  ORF Transcript_34786/g.83004 Transcript_34786/m.83004 type:complete len:205 (-) Transcript_34786:794-1408(-)